MSQVRVNTRADLEISRPGVEVPVCVASYRVARIAPADLDNPDDARAVSIRFGVDLGALAEHAELIVPFAALAEYVDQVRETSQHGDDLDGFHDALDHLPARGRSRRYLDAYTLGQVEAHARAE